MDRNCLYKTIIASKKIKSKRDYVLFKDYECFKRDIYA